MHPIPRAAAAVAEREETVTGGAVTPHQLLDLVRASHEAEERAGVDLLVLAVAWADAHPVDDDGPVSQWWRPVRPGTRSVEDDGGLDLDTAQGLAGTESGPDEVDPEWFGIPPVRWDAPASFAAAHRVSTSAGKALIRDALVLEHRLPRTWAKTLGGGVPAWRARRVAQSVLGAPPDVVAWVDARVHWVVSTIGTRGLDRLLDDAMLELHAEEREIEQLAALDARHATLHRSTINHTGIVEMSLRGDYADLDDFDRVLSVVAAALAAADAAAGTDEQLDSLDVRRARAVGILADPARALALLHPTEPDTPDGPPCSSAPPQTAGPAPRREVVAYLHLTPDHLAGLAVFVRDDRTLRQVIEGQVRSWCGRGDTYLRIQPVIDLNDDPGTHSTSAYAPSDALRARVLLRHPTCVFPFCERPSRDLQLDHVVAYVDPGPEAPDPTGSPPTPQTSELNLAPLCTHHHQLKTHAGWTYVAVDPTGPRPTFRWRGPHGDLFLRSRDGTTCLTS